MNSIDAPPKAPCSLKKNNRVFARLCPEHRALLTEIIVAAFAYMPAPPNMGAAREAEVQIVDHFLNPTR